MTNVNVLSLKSFFELNEIQDEVQLSLSKIQEYLKDSLKNLIEQSNIPESDYIIEFSFNSHNILTIYFLYENSREITLTITKVNSQSSLNAKLSHSTRNLATTQSIQQKSSFFVKIFSFLEVLSEQLSNPDSGINKLIVDSYLEYKKIKESLVELEFFIEKSIDKREEELRIELVKNSNLVPVNFKDIYNLLKDKQEHSFIYPSLIIEKDQLFRDNPECSLNLNTFQIQRCGHSFAALNKPIYISRDSFNKEYLEKLCSQIYYT